MVSNMYVNAYVKQQLELFKGNNLSTHLILNVYLIYTIFKNGDLNK